MSAQAWAMDILGGTARGNEVVCDCLFCGKEGHMYVNGVTGLAYCFVCGAGANLAKLIAELEGVDEDYAYVKAQRILGGDADVRATDEHIAAAYVRLMHGRVDTTVQRNSVALPKNCVPIGDMRAKAARDYMHGRKFTQAHWHRYGLLFCPRGADDERRFSRHIVFPHTDSTGALTFYTTRAAFEPSGAFPKSYHPGGAKRGGLLFGEYALRPCVHAGTAPLFIVEGPMDMLALSGYAVALTGKFMSDAQALAASKYAHAVVALDADANVDATRACEALRAAGVRDVRLCTFYAHNAKDPGALAHYGIREALRTVYANSRPYTATTGLRARMRAKSVLATGNL